ncbi:YIP1 family protein [Cohnella sp. WQ 127256]|uniref:YIP1 family protein n=1 Tax=Cohnella sp. WQ 127256 TaxID=2938790 RepID=UPI0021195E8F|nr:YIP1 family protein [Cohnella sp. WQ 127256]
MFDRTRHGLLIKAFATCCLLGLLFPEFVSAQLPYHTWYRDLNSGMIATQPIYVPDRVIDGNRVEGGLASPSDVYIAGDNHVYIADTSNNRIVELDEGGEYLRSVGMEAGPGKLNQPEGVFVSADGMIYAANTGGQSIIRYSANGRFDREFKKPESKVLTADYHFLPTKLVVDRRGVMYIVVKDTFLGLLRMSPDGEFTGFFGANKAKLSWLDRLKRSLLNERQMAQEISKQPNPIQNVSLAADGFLLTTSSGLSSDGQIKKLNAGGFDAFHNKAFWEPHLVDTAIDQNGFMYGLNRDNVVSISVYDPTGEVMFYFGSTEKSARQLGITDYGISIDINSNNELWVVDNASNLIHIFKRTSFGDTYMMAAHLYFDGDYEQSRSYWEEVIRQNGMLNIAYNGLGKIALHDRDYRTALDYFKQSNDSVGYSNAFWYIRYEWLKQNFLYAVVVLVIAIWGLSFLARRAAAFIRKRIWPARLKRYSSELRDALYVMVHPYQGFYRLKDRNISYGVICFLLLLAIGIHIWSVFASGFISYPFELGNYNIPRSLAFKVVPWVTWVIANYLVSAVKGGEGKFREVLQASTFALVPYIVITIPTTILTNFVVLEEWIIIDLITRGMWIWIIVLFFVMTQVIHNFDFTEAVKNAAITIFTIGVIWVFVMIISGLAYNFYDFIEQTYREVTYRA